VAGIVGVAVLAVLGWGVIAQVRHARRAAVVFNDQTAMPELKDALRAGDARALLILFPRIATPAGAAPKAATQVEAKDFLEILGSLRTGFLRFGSYGRISSMMMVTEILKRFAVEPAPAEWFYGLHSIHDLFASGLADPDLQTRIAALNEVGRFWSWFPGRSMMEAEESVLVDWKAALYAPVLRHLGDREPHARAAAVACLSMLPDDQAAVKALPYLEDNSDGGVLVRKQVLASFARRPALLTDDMVLKHLQDRDADVVEMAEILLKARGLTQEQVDLGRLIFDPKPEHRASVIPRLQSRSDIDPVVWLLQLSHDTSELVRADAVKALLEHLSPEVVERLGEMARSDTSPAVRQAAARFASSPPRPPTATASPIPMPRPRTGNSAEAAPGRPEATVALPPLPGSTSLNPKAN
jgi:HEAT repeat protein